jgi:hypothetical protein
VVTSPSSLHVTVGSNYKGVRLILEQGRVRRGDMIGVRSAKCATSKHLGLFVWHVCVSMWLCIANRTVVDNSLDTELQLLEKSTAARMVDVHSKTPVSDVFFSCASCEHCSP